MFLNFLNFPYQKYGSFKRNARAIACWIFKRFGIITLVLLTIGISMILGSFVEALYIIDTDGSLLIESPLDARLILMSEEDIPGIPLFREDFLKKNAEELYVGIGGTHHLQLVVNDQGFFKYRMGISLPTEVQMEIRGVVITEVKKRIESIDLEENRIKVTYGIDTRYYLIAFPLSTAFYTVILTLVFFLNIKKFFAKRR